MKFNNEYTNLINKIDTNDEFKKKLIEKIKEEELKKGMIKMKIQSKITALIASLGIITCSSIAYATLVPEEIKDTISDKISTFFGIEVKENEEVKYDVGVQEETLDSIIESDIENVEDYSELTNPDLYGIGDSNGGSLVESNYKQYNWDAEYDEDGSLIEKPIQKYEEIIKIKLGAVNYGCLEKFDNENTILDEFGTVIERKESTIEETLEYQYDEFTNNWDEYYHGDVNNEKLYFKITGMLVMNGNNSTEENYYNNARAKKIKVIFDGQDEKIIKLKDSKDAQFIDLEYISYDISKPIDISIEVLETYKGNITNDVYVADVQFGISSNIPQGR